MNFGDGLGKLSDCTDDVLAKPGTVVGLGVLLIGIGKIGMVTPPGVGNGGGGWSELDGNVVLIENMKVAPSPGTPLALISPPCN